MVSVSGVIQVYFLPVNYEYILDKNIKFVGHQGSYEKCLWSVWSIPVQTTQIQTSGTKQPKLQTLRTLIGKRNKKDQQPMWTNRVLVLSCWVLPSSRSHSLRKEETESDKLDFEISWRSRKEKKKKEILCFSHWTSKWVFYSLHNEAWSFCLWCHCRTKTRKERFITISF